MNRQDSIAPGAPANAALSTVPRVGPGFRLQWESAQSCFVLLYPEGMVKLNQSAGEIMKRCDGRQDAAAIVADLEAAFSATGLQADVLAFIDMAGAQRWLAWDGPP
jgi:pyrroloquinoline quinone biosynthesis protein D